jgi:hypothetical protein
VNKSLTASGSRLLLPTPLSTSLVSLSLHRLLLLTDLVSSCLQSSLVLGEYPYSMEFLNIPLIKSRFAALKVNYMTIPVYVLGAISLTIQVYFSDKLRKRGAFIVGCCIPVAVGYLICVGTPNPNAGYAGMFILVIGKLYPRSAVLL